MFKAKLAIVLLLCLPLATHAALIRNAGKGSVSISFPTWYTIVPEAEMVADGLINADYEFITAGYGPGQGAVNALPTECYVMLGSSDEPFEDDPCYWQFARQEALHLFGFTYLFLAEADINFEWLISNDSQQWLFGSEFSSFQDGPVNQTQRQVFLDAAMPAGMSAGEYQVSLRMSLTAPQGYTFIFLDTFNPDVYCIDELDGCFRFGSALGNTLQFTSATERLVVVSEPATLAFFAAIPLLLSWRRRRQML
jgi:hypothetical protein